MLSYVVRSSNNNSRNLYVILITILGTAQRLGSLWWHGHKNYYFDEERFSCVTWLAVYFVAIPIKGKCPTVLLQSTDFIMTRLAPIKQINSVQRGFLTLLSVASQKKITLCVTLRDKRPKLSDIEREKEQE